MKLLQNLQILLVFLVYWIYTGIEARPVSAALASGHNRIEETNTNLETLEEDDLYFEGDLIVSPELIEEYYGDGTKVSS